MILGLYSLIDGIWLAATGIYLIRDDHQGLSQLDVALFLLLSTVFSVIAVALLGLVAYVKFVVVPQTLKSLIATRGSSNHLQ